MRQQRIFAVIVAGTTFLPIHLAAQTPANRALATFPAQQRPPGDPALITRGKTLYSISCQACHGVDLRGGDLGGPNLLRSQVVLSDQDGELILPIVQGARQANGMPAISMAADDVKATATYIHSVVGTAKTQGAPPDAGIAPTSILVGDAAAGQQYFAAKCGSCHSVTADLQGIATRYPDPKLLQNRWVAGGGGGRGAANSDRRAVTVKVTKPGGEVVEGRLVRIDDFLVTLANADGSLTTIRRDGDKPKVEVTDPMQAHRDLLAVYTDKNMHDVTAYLVTVK
jgi:cytochrome c oxidase cbb3-type subunit III